MTNVAQILSTISKLGEQLQASPDEEMRSGTARVTLAALASQVTMLVADEQRTPATPPTDSCQQQLWNAKAAFDDAMRGDKIDASRMGDIVQSFTQLEEMFVRAGFGKALDVARGVIAHQRETFLRTASVAPEK